jgi:transcriptional regulator with XRE-family HTH domain
METGVGKRIKKRRIELNLTQEELANRMGYKSKAAICKVEGGEDNITSDRIRKFADALETTPAFLMGWTAAADLQIDNSPATETIDNNIVERATKLYNLYLQAPPEIQAAIETLLKSQSHDS